MAFIRARKTRQGIVVYHITEKVDGKQISKLIPARSKREANEYLKMYEGERSFGKPPSLLIKDKSFDALVKEYYADAQYRKTASTNRTDRSMLKILLTEFGGMKLAQLTAQKIDLVQCKWKQAGLSNKTINNRSILLGTMMRFAMEHEWLAQLPKIKKMKIDKTLPNFFSDEEVASILDNAEGTLRDYLVVFLNTGLRMGELQNLKWENVDFDNRQLRVETSKSHRFRVVDLNDVLYILMRQLQKKQTANQIYVFEYNAGKPVNDYYHRFKKLLLKLGIEGNVHKLRHTFASRLVQNGVSIYEVQHLLGHASVQTTQVYAHIRQENLKKAVNSLNGWLVGGQTEKEPQLMIA